ncbi:SRPBCC family protein [Streptomyces lasiicapitis]|uniref:SRPBCC family protein n=1 Tax=Streptomyces lasiicapitis TaxID=1923961 RepID=UPI0036610D8B
MNSTATANTAIAYTTYVAADPEQVWRALTAPDQTDRWWGVTFGSDWKPGSPMTWRQGDARIEEQEQVVLECVPQRRLAYTWHTFTPEWARAVDVPEDLRARIAAEPRTKVSFTIDPQGPLTRLTVVHDDFTPEGELHGMCSQAWPLLVSSLKTLLETGRPLPDPGHNAHEG